MNHAGSEAGRTSSRSKLMRPVIQEAPSPCDNPAEVQPDINLLLSHIQYVSGKWNSSRALEIRENRPSISI